VADVLLINLNDGTQEVEALKKLTAQNNERLYILPETSGNPEYGTDEFTKDVLRLAAKGVRPRALVLSGHHYEDQFFYGTSGKVVVHKIVESLKLLPASPATNEFFASIQSLYLWGCYTGTLANTDKLVYVQKSPFINAKYLVGFLKKGPLGTTRESGQLLQNALMKESQIRRAAPAEKQALVAGILGKSHYEMMIHDGENFFTNSSFSNRPQYLRTCLTQETYEKFDQATDTFYQYLHNKIGPIPEDTSGGALRQVYQVLQEYGYCFDKNHVELPRTDPVPIDRAIRMVFYYNVVKNFARIYREKLVEIQQIFVISKMVGTEFVTRMDKTDRGELIERLNDLDAQNFALYFHELDKANMTHFFLLKAVINDLRKVIYGNPIAIPSNWNEWSEDPEKGNKLGGHFNTFHNFQGARAAAAAKAEQCISTRTCGRQ
jgi:hypothetical protein